MKSFIASPSKRAAVFALLFLLVSVTGLAQTPPSINSSDFEQAFIQGGISTRYSDTAITGTAGMQLQSLVNLTGADQTWNFESLPFRRNTPLSGESVSVSTYPGGAALADSFPTATHVEMITYDGDTSYDFYQITETGFYSLGYSQVIGGVASVGLRYTPPFQSLAFPLTYETQWTAASVAINPGEDTTQEQTDYYVDSWGTFTLPGTTPNSVLRLREKSTQVSSLYHDTSYSYDWISPSGYSAGVTTDSSQNALGASYSVPPAPNIVLNNNPSSEFSISVAANPVSSQTSVSFTLPSESQVRISLMDALGRESHVLMNSMAPAGTNTLPLDPANLMNGTYFLRMESDGNSAMQKVIVNR
jgi:hypothetical protein